MYAAAAGALFWWMEGAGWRAVNLGCTSIKFVAGFIASGLNSLGAHHGTATTTAMGAAMGMHGRRHGHDHSHGYSSRRGHWHGLGHSHSPHMVRKDTVPST